jgi:pectinesterase
MSNGRLMRLSCFVCVVLLVFPLLVQAQLHERADIVVSVSGGGDFRSIQEALNSVGSDHVKPVVILIRNGVYNEKLFIQKSHVTLVGEDWDSTRIVYAELRENWHEKNGGSDWGSAVINIDSGTTDVTLANLTAYNNYGWKNGVFNKHQFTIRGAGTRIMLLHCKVISDGGDAVSLWDRTDGMYYHADCFFEGWVDYVCPRGWCYITDSDFFGHNKSASLWHDGSMDKRQKFVITDSYFDGVPGFPLGRHHHDGQFFLVNCSFSRNMADKPIYYPLESPNARPWIWGDRHYFFNCHRDEGDYEWFADNLQKADGSPKPEDITAKWTFDGMWDPEATMPSVLPFAFHPSPKNHAIVADSVRLSWVGGRNADSHNLFLGTTGDMELIGNLKKASFQLGRLKPQTTYFWRVDEVTEDGVVQGATWRFSTE